MECVEAKAFKTSLWRPEMLVKSSSNHHDEEVSKFSLWGSSNNNGGTPTNGDETFVDDLLDFSNEETVKENEEEDDYETVVDDNNTSTEIMKTVFSPEKNSSASLKNDFASVFASELSVPTDDLADLEWLSHFVEDSFSEEFSQTQYNDGNPTVLAVPKPQYQVKTEPEKKQQFIKTEAIETVGYYGFSPQPPPPTTTTTTAAAATTVPGKARSKRSRTGGRVWSLGYSTLTETSSSSTSTTTTTSSTTSSSSSYLIFNNIMRSPDYLVSLRKPPVVRHKKQRVVNGDDNGGCGGGGARVVRTQCSHCGVQKTPQWRTGPLGAKTLCNACGVRFKSGRLLPEYRPASSPTFSKAVHSNSHRKVLEIRKKKEVVAAPEAGFTSAVHSF